MIMSLESEGGGSGFEGISQFKELLGSSSSAVFGKNGAGALFEINLVGGVLEIVDLAEDKSHFLHSDKIESFDGEDAMPTITKKELKQIFEKVKLMDRLE